MQPHLKNFYRCLKQKTKLIGSAAGKAKERGKRIFQNAVSFLKKFSIRKVIDAVSMKLVIAVSGSLAVVMTVMLFYGIGFRFGYHVYMDGEYIASISDKTVLDNSVENAAKVLGTSYKFESVPTARFAIVRSPSKDITSNIINNLDDITNGVVLTVDGKNIVTFANSEDATETLSLILQNSKAEGATSAEFVNEMQLTEQFVKKTSVQDAAAAAELLTSYKVSPKVYTLSAGENLDTVSEKLMITKEELLNRNTAFTEADFKEGTEIVINRPEKVISVKSNFSVSYTEEIPFEIQKVDDASLYRGVTTVKTTGQNGLKQLIRESSEIDGVRVASNVVEEVVTKEPVPQVESVGTKNYAEGVVTGLYERPIGGIVTSRYGSRWGTVHKGVDIDGETGDPIKAADGGTVISAGDSGDGYGFKVIIDHGDGSQTLYAHCNELLVAPGIKVEKGDVIATVGNTGYSTGSHLHFEVIINGQSVDPLTFFNE